MAASLTPPQTNLSRAGWVTSSCSKPHAKAYQPAPPGWTFTLRERAAGIDIGAVRDDAGEHEATISSVNWMGAAEQVFLLMTGWSLPLDLVDYAARVLRVRAFLHQSITSGELDNLLTMYELAHAAAVRGGPWMSPEYATILE
jgi:hypothetical protein